MANRQLRWLLTSATRGAEAIWDWYRELGHENDSEARGLRLLREWLSPEQLAQYDASTFDVIGCHSGKRYRIRHGTATNIHELDDAGDPTAGWCFVPRDYLVAGDVMLAQRSPLNQRARCAGGGKKFCAEMDETVTRSELPRIAPRAAAIRHVL
jgi:hypothetical protein